MKTQILARICSFLIALCLWSPHVVAKDADSAITRFTVEFMQSLIACRPGEYVEPNFIVRFTGAPFLQHKILGPDEDNFCMVDMETPDGRNLSCSFGPVATSYISDQIMLEGLFGYNLKKPSLKSLIAEEQWSKIKQFNCAIY